MFSLFPEITAGALFTLCLGRDLCDDLHLSAFCFCLPHNELGNVVLPLPSESLNALYFPVILKVMGQTVLLLRALQVFLILRRCIS